jgi:hypothetical protein
MAAAANRASTAIEFIVKPKDDLFLEGTLRTLPRVTKGTYWTYYRDKSATYSLIDLLKPNFLSFGRGALSVSNAEESNFQLPFSTLREA